MVAASEGVGEEGGKAVQARGRLASKNREPVGATRTRQQLMLARSDSRSKAEVLKASACIDGFSNSDRFWTTARVGDFLLPSLIPTDYRSSSYVTTALEGLAALNGLGRHLSGDTKLFKLRSGCP